MKKRFTLVAAFMLALSVQAQHQDKSVFMPGKQKMEKPSHKSLYAPLPRPLAGEMPYDTLLVTSMGESSYSSSDAEKLQDRQYLCNLR